MRTPQENVMRIRCFQHRAINCSLMQAIFSSLYLPFEKCSKRICARVIVADSLKCTASATETKCFVTKLLFMHSAWGQSPGSKNSLVLVQVADQGRQWKLECTRKKDRVCRCLDADSSDLHDIHRPQGKKKQRELLFSQRAD